MRVGIKVWLAASLVAAGVLLRFPPERYGFYPRCPVFEAFGLLCPGCGATRAAAALLLGHWAEAWRSNALFTASLTAVPIYGLAGWRGRSWPTPRGWTVAVALAMTVAFGVARNLAKA